MNLKKIPSYIIRIVITILFFGNQDIFAISGELVEKTTIRQMQENIEVLEQEKNLLEFKWQTFKVGNTSLGELLRPDLTLLESEELTLLVSSYNDSNIFEEMILKNIIDTSGDEIAQREKLLSIKIQFYSSLEPFIQIEKMEELNLYAGTDVSYDEQTKDVDSKIQKIQNEKQEKVEYYQEKIEDNNKIIRENIENKVLTDVKTKLDIFTQQEEFLNLPNIAKIEVFDKVITKLEYESIRITNLQNSTSIIEEKILVFRVVINLLKEYTNSWK